jgi:hypothetical protein
MSLMTNLSIKVTGQDGALTELLPTGMEIKYKISLESQDLIRSVSGKPVIENRDAKIRLIVEGVGLIPDLLRACYLNSILHVIPGVRIYSTQNIPEYVDPESIIQKQNTSSYRLNLQMIMAHFSCEHQEADLSTDSGSKWKLILEEV